MAAVWAAGPEPMMTSLECMPRVCCCWWWSERLDEGGAVGRAVGGREVGEEAKGSPLVLRGRKAAPARAMLKLGCREERRGRRKAEWNSLAVARWSGRSVFVELGRVKRGSSTRGRPAVGSRALPSGVFQNSMDDKGREFYETRVMLCG